MPEQALNSILASVVGTSSIGKGAALGGMVGMMGVVSDEMRRVWPFVVAVLAIIMVPSITGGFFMGTMSQELEATKEQTAKDDAALKEQLARDMTAIKDVVISEVGNVRDVFKGELALRDLKIDYAYDSARKGGRYTAEMAQEHDDLDDQRYYAQDGRIGDLENLCTDTRKRVSLIEESHNLGYHHSADE